MDADFELDGMPKILFKYRDYANNWNKRTLFNYELFMASTSMFNDPYEGSIPFIYEKSELTPENIFLKMHEIAKQNHPDWDEKQLHEFCYNAQRNDLLNDETHLRRENEKNRELINKTFGILSLTIHPKNYLMWSHYSNCHTGFCRGFDTNILYKTVGGAIGPVKYNPNLPKFRLFEAVEDFHRKQLGTKSNIWSYEDEFRIVKSNASKQTISFPKEMIKFIYLGCNMSFDIDNKIVHFVKNQIIECQIFKLQIDKDDFKLNEIRIY